MDAPGVLDARSARTWRNRPGTKRALIKFLGRGRVGGSRSTERDMISSNYRFRTKKNNSYTHTHTHKRKNIRLNVAWYGIVVMVYCSMVQYSMTYYSVDIWIPHPGALDPSIGDARNPEAYLATRTSFLEYLGFFFNMLPSL